MPPVVYMTGWTTSSVVIARVDLLSPRSGAPLDGEGILLLGPLGGDGVDGLGQCAVSFTIVSCQMLVCGLRKRDMAGAGTW